MGPGFIRTPMIAALEGDPETLGARLLGAFFGVWLGGYVFDVTKSYDLVWFGSIALGLLAAALHMPINDANVMRTEPLAAQA